MALDDRDRRQLLRDAVACVAGLGSLRVATGAATEVRTELREDEPAAKAVAYFANAAKVDVKLFPSYRRGQSCTTCAQLEFGTARQRPCKIIPGRLVNAAGWCKVWVLRGS